MMIQGAFPKKKRSRYKCCQLSANAKTCVLVISGAVIAILPENVGGGNVPCQIEAKKNENSVNINLYHNLTKLSISLISAIKQFENVDIMLCCYC